MTLVIKSSDQTRQRGLHLSHTVLVIMLMWMCLCLYAGVEIRLRSVCTQKMMSHILFTPKQTGITKYFLISDGNKCAKTIP